VAGTWTLQSITEPLYAGAAGLTFLIILGFGVLVVMSENTNQKSQPPSDPTGRAVAYCNACGKANWANIADCHYCGTHMPVSRAT